MDSIAAEPVIDAIEVVNAAKGRAAVEQVSQPYSDIQRAGRLEIAFALILFLGVAAAALAGAALALSGIGEAEVRADAAHRMALYNRLGHGPLQNRPDIGVNW